MLLIERSNKIEGTADSYTPEQLALLMSKGASMHQFPGRAVFTPSGHKKAHEISRKVQAYVRLCHTWHPENDVGAWDFEYAMQRCNPWMMQTPGGPVARWKSQDSPYPTDWMYCGDGYRNDSRVWAGHIAAKVTQYPVHSLFIDYLSLGVWDVDKKAVADISPAQRRYYRTYQVNFMRHLRAMLPDVELMVNGPWCLENVSLLQQGLVDSVFVEKCGGLWHTAGRMRQWAADLATFFPAVDMCWDYSATPRRLGMPASVLAAEMASTYGHETAEKLRF